MSVLELGSTVHKIGIKRLFTSTIDAQTHLQTSPDFGCGLDYCGEEPTARAQGHRYSLRLLPLTVGTWVDTCQRKTFSWQFLLLILQLPIWVVKAEHLYTQVHLLSGKVDGGREECGEREGRREGKLPQANRLQERHVPTANMHM